MKSYTVTVLYISHYNNLDNYIEMIEKLNSDISGLGINYDVVMAATALELNKVCNEDGTLKEKTDILVINGGSRANNIDIINSNLGKGMAVVVPTADIESMQIKTRKLGIEGMSLINDFMSSEVEDWKKGFEEAINNINNQKAVSNYEINKLEELSRIVTIPRQRKAGDNKIIISQKSSGELKNFLVINSEKEPDTKVVSHQSSGLIGCIKNFIKMVSDTMQNIGKGRTH